MIRTEAQEAFWQKFLAASGRDSSTPCYDCFHFCLDEKSANELLELVLAGKNARQQAAFRHMRGKASVRRRRAI